MCSWSAHFDSYESVAALFAVPRLILLPVITPFCSTAAFRVSFWELASGLRHYISLLVLRWVIAHCVTIPYFLLSEFNYSVIPFQRYFTPYFLVLWHFLYVVLDDRPALSEFLAATSLSLFSKVLRQLIICQLILPKATLSLCYPQLRARVQLQSGGIQRSACCVHQVDIFGASIVLILALNASLSVIQSLVSMSSRIVFSRLHSLLTLSVVSYPMHPYAMWVIICVA